MKMALFKVKFHGISSLMRFWEYRLAQMKHNRQVQFSVTLSSNWSNICGLSV